MFAQQHPDRLALHNEVHARPYDPVAAPCTILHWVYDTTGIKAEAIVAHLASLMHAYHLPQPHLTSNQITVQLPYFTLRWERHTEFVTFTAWQLPSESQDQPTLQHLQSALPIQWLQQACGRLLSAIELQISCTNNDTCMPNVGANTVQALLADACVTVQTDFQIMGNGYSQWRVFVHDENQSSNKPTW